MEEERAMDGPFVAPSRTDLCDPDVAPSAIALRAVVAQRRLSAEECERVVRVSSSFPVCRTAVVGDSHLVAFRMGKMRKVLPSSEEAREIYDDISAVARAENERHFRLELTGVIRAPEFVEYTCGDGQFDWHDDYSHEGSESPRKLTVVFQLSDADEYEGGSFQSWSVPIQTLARGKGSILVLPSFVPHRVTPVTRGIRRILVAWIGGPRLR